MMTLIDRGAMALLSVCIATFLLSCSADPLRPPEGVAGSDTLVEVSPAAPGEPSSGSVERGTIVTGRQWSISDDGHFVSADGPTLRLKFAYDAEGWQGWFRGGGGHDGAIVELYYKPTSTTRNLAFRNGVAGGKLDGLDYFQAEGASVDQMDHNTADFASGTHARVVGRRVWESAGRLYAEFDLDFEAWSITRTYIVYPWGDITMHARFTQRVAGRWSYLGRRIHFAVSRYRVANGATTYDWGGNYESDGEHFYAWSDGHGENGGAEGTGYFRYDEVIRKDLNRNSVIRQFGRGDHYSGFMIDDRNENDPDIVVMNGDPSEFESPFGRISRAVGGKEYVETGIFSPTWSGHTTHAGMNWFYNTIACCPAEYSNPMYWPTSLGTWDESFQVLFRQKIGPDDYLALWKARARDVRSSQPFDVSDAVVHFDPVDRVYHVRANPGSTVVRFRWRRPEAAARALDYRTAFVVEGLSNARAVSVDGASPPQVAAYRDVGGDILVVLVGDQPATPQPLEITVR
jgi:hypothetical protein